MNVKLNLSFGSKKEVLINWDNVVYATEVLHETHPISESKQTEITFVNGRIMQVNQPLEDIEYKL